MSLRRIALICASAAGLALAGAASAQPVGNPMPHVGPGMTPGMPMPAAPALPSVPYPGAPPLPSAPDMRPAWQGAANVLMPDARTRDAWLDECHRRTAMYYGGYRKSRRHRDDWRRDDRAYSYCEAYFDDYYRTYRAHGHVVYAHAPMMMAHAPMAPAAKQNCVETETVEYVPVRTRVIPRRPAPRRVVPDKRVRDKRMQMD